MDDQSVNRNEAPHFIVDSDEESVNLRIKMFEQTIYNRPVAVKAALSNIGEVATSHTLEQVTALDEPTGDTIESIETVVDGDVIAWLREYFNYKYDYDVGFDRETNITLEQDASYTKARNEFRAHQTSDEIENLRTTVRKARLNHFVGQVILWQNTINEQSRDLPSAS